jgi:hypothetical protein
MKLFSAVRVDSYRTTPPLASLNRAYSVGGTGNSGGGPGDDGFADNAFAEHEASPDVRRKYSQEKEL